MALYILEIKVIFTKKNNLNKDILAQFSTFLRRFNDDAIDRLHYLHTVIGLSIYLVFLSSKLYLGDPLQCAIHGNSISSDMAKYIHSM